MTTTLHIDLTRERVRSLNDDQLQALYAMLRKLSDYTLTITYQHDTLLGSQDNFLTPLAKELGVASEQCRVEQQMRALTGGATREG